MDGRKILAHGSVFAGESSIGNGCNESSHCGYSKDSRCF